MGKEGPLTDAELTLVRRHPYETGRIFGRSETLGSIGALAALHHETLDGRGYHRGLSGDMLSPAAPPDCRQRLSVAHRPTSAREALSATRLRGINVRSRMWPHGRRRARAIASAASDVSGVVAASPLSERERQRRTLARGNATKSPRVAHRVQDTADRHIQNVYAKIGSQRAAVPLYAMRQRLV